MLCARSVRLPICSTKRVPRAVAARSARTRVWRNDESINTASVLHVDHDKVVAENLAAQRAAISFLVAEPCAPCKATTATLSPGYVTSTSSITPPILR